MKLRTRLFLAAFGIAGVSLLLAAALVAWSLEGQLLDRITNELVDEAQLVAELMERSGGGRSMADVDREADSLGERLNARVTIVDAEGRVLGDSAEDGVSLAALDNHGARPEITIARDAGVGVMRRYSTTVDRDLLYAAVRVDHPDIAFVRLALPLTAVDDQITSVQGATAVGLLLALGGALVLAWITSTAMSRRVRTIAEAAQRYRQGDLTPPVGNYGNDEIGTVARALDVSVQELGRRLAELSRNRRLTDAILGSMSEGVLVVNARGRVQMANDAVCEMLQIPETPVDHHYVELIRHPDVAKQIGRALEAGGSSRVEITLSTEPVKICLASAAPYTAQDEPGVVIVLHDISDFRRAAQIRQDFVANVSHELRTPLTAIRGAVDTLEEESDPESERRFLDIIKRHTQRMERLVADLLRLAGLDSGKEQLHLRRSATETLVSGIASELAPVLGAKRQRVESDIDPSANRLVVDPAKMHDVLKNLVENAAHYAPDGSSIDVAASANGGGKAVRIRIADRGPGIPDTDLDRVFERFYRVEDSRARNPGGTGLGLAIVKHLVGLHGGTVEAANRPGGGSVFTIVLPQRPAEVDDELPGADASDARSDDAAAQSAGV
ncbi:MAG: HAMP domain-containing protein [Acidobacteria bacterium]|nr:HAMP domain-containing protein [Acidobacteriota bacterium]